MKKLFKGFAWAIVVLFIFMNVIAAFHANKFTHFVAKKAEAEKPSKLKTILLGVENSRPENITYPSQKFETVKIKSNVMLEAWSIKTDSTAKGTVIIFHGYRGEKSSMLDRSDELLKMGYNTLLVDFMGSGGSEGSYTTIGYKEADEVRDCFNYLQLSGEKNIYLFGTSMGAVSIMKAINDYHVQPKAVLLECPFGSMYKTVCARFNLMHVNPVPMASFLMFWGGVENGFWAFSHNPTEYAKQDSLPTLLMQGEADEKVSREETAEIFANLAGKKELKTYPLAHHEDYLIKYHDKWVGDVSGFLQTIGN